MTADFDARMAALAARFRERADDAKQKLGPALAAGDMAEVARIAHILAGSGGLFGYPAISAKAEQVELAAEAEDRTLLARVMPELLQLLDQAVQGR